MFAGWSPRCVASTYKAVYLSITGPTPNCFQSRRHFGPKVADGTLFSASASAAAAQSPGHAHTVGWMSGNMEVELCMGVGSGLLHYHICTYVCSLNIYKYMRVIHGKIINLQKQHHHTSLPLGGGCLGCLSWPWLIIHASTRGACTHSHGSWSSQWYPHRYSPRLTRLNSHTHCFRDCIWISCWRW